MITFLGSALSIYIIGVMTVLTINFTFDLFLDLSSMEITFLHNIPTMTDPLLSLIFVTPKVIMSGTISHLSYIITDLVRDSYNFGTELIQAYINSLTHHLTIQYI